MCGTKLSNVQFKVEFESLFEEEEDKEEKRKELKRKRDLLELESSYSQKLKKFVFITVLNLLFFLKLQFDWS